MRSSSRRSRADLLATRSAHKAPYQERTTANSESQFEMLQRLELDAAAHHRLIEHSRKIGIQFLSSPFDMQSADLLTTMDVPLFKVPSGEITNLPFLEHVASKGRPVIGANRHVHISARWKKPCMSCRPPEPRS